MEFEKEGSEQTYDRAFGCLLGALIGDASGALLEKLGRKPTGDEANIAMLMMGGGAMRLASGQCTDDGEMTISLARGLDKFDLNKIAHSYSDWVSSPPFDMGITIGASIGCVLKGKNNSAFQKHLNEVGYAQAMKNAAIFDGGTSKSNGSLMRCSPIGIYGYKLKDDEIAFIASEDSKLSHPNQTVCDASAVYCIAIAELIKSGNSKKAFERAFEWAQKKATKEVVEWMEEAKKNIQTEYFPNTGYIKVAFTHAFRHLLLETQFKEAMRETLEAGGDTDTNACIIGALLGTLIGAEKLPKNMVAAVLNCKTETGRPRPDFLKQSQIPELVKKLLEIAPNSLVK